MLILELGAKTSQWRGQEDHSFLVSAKGAAIRKQTLSRDKFTCQQCGLSALLGIDVHHLNDDHSDNTPKNLTSLCFTCHMTQHIGLAGLNNLGHLVFMPGITQAAFNWLTLWFDYGIYSEAGVGKIPAMIGARHNVTLALQEAKVLATERLGTSDLNDLANMFITVPEGIYQEKIRPRLQGMLFRPNYAAYNPKIIASWSETLFTLIPTTSSIQPFVGNLVS